MMSKLLQFPDGGKTKVFIGGVPLQVDRIFCLIISPYIAMGDFIARKTATIALKYKLRAVCRQMLHGASGRAAEKQR